MICPYCKKEARWCENKEIYGKNYGVSYMCWLCKDCDAYVGCHQNTKKPLGSMANQNLRDLRVECHQMFDRLWKDGKMTRDQAYRWMQRNMKLPEERAHIGELRESGCKWLIKILRRKIQRDHENTNRN